MSENTGREGLEIRIRPSDPNDPPDILRDLVAQVHELLPTTGEAAGSWLRGKSQQELAKAAEIRANILGRLGELDLERQRLIQEREEAKKAASLGRLHERNRHSEQMYHHETERRAMEAEAYRKKAEALKDIIKAISDLRDLGIDVEVALKTVAGVIEGATPRTVLPANAVGPTTKETPSDIVRP